MENYLISLIERLGCDRNLLYEIQKEVFGDCAESGSLSKCREYALAKLNEFSKSTNWTQVNSRAERFSANWGKFRYETRRSDKERSYALYGILLDLSGWYEMRGYWMEQCKLLAHRLNEMSDNKPSVVFVNDETGEEEAMENLDDAHERFGDLFDSCSEIRVHFRVVKEWKP